MASTDRSLFNIGGGDDDEVNKNLLLNDPMSGMAGLSLGNTDPKPPPDANYKVVQPRPGFCLKTKKQDSSEKVFLNVCISEEVNAPRKIGEEELIRLLDDGDMMSYRVPMSIGEPRAELDKSGTGCTAIDVIVNPAYLKELDDSRVHEGFFLTVLFEGVEHKYGVVLSREWVRLRNRKAIGQLQTQYVRTQSKPVIMEMDGGQTPPSSSAPSGAKPGATSSEPEKPRAPEPEFAIVQEPTEGHPEFLVAEIQLPKISAARGLQLDIGEDRILLETRSNVYYLDIFLPFRLVQEDVGAEFNRKTKVLTITMPVQPLS